MNTPQRRHLNRCGLTLYLDVHVIDSALPSAQELERLCEEGWLALARADVLDTELAECTDPAKRQALEDLSRPYPESLGPWVLGHSRLGHTTLGSQEDKDRLHRVYAMLFPGVVDPTAASANHLRDAMHIATAVRSGGDAFVTTEKRLLNKDAAAREAFTGFRLWHPDDALVEVMARIRTLHAPHAREPCTEACPPIPPD